jgi:hypothetical protein
MTSISSQKPNLLANCAPARLRAMDTNRSQFVTFKEAVKAGVSLWAAPVVSLCGAPVLLLSDAFESK